LSTFLKGRRNKEITIFLQALELGMDEIPVEKINLQVGELRKNCCTRSAVSAAMEPPRE
jgi:hypothetical protein